MGKKINPPERERERESEVGKNGRNLQACFKYPFLGVDGRKLAKNDLVTLGFILYHGQK